MAKSTPVASHPLLCVSAGVFEVESIYEMCELKVEVGDLKLCNWKLRCLGRLGRMRLGRLGDIVGGQCLSRSRRNSLEPKSRAEYLRFQLAKSSRAVSFGRTRSSVKC